MQIVVITGSTRGIGLGLAQAFLDRGCAVIICSRSTEAVSRVVTYLSSRYSQERVLGIPCDVTNLDQVHKLWQGAVDRFGHIDIWINNAGMTTSRRLTHELDASERESVVRVNLLGTVNGCAVAAPAMIEQGHGAIYNMEGLGSDGRIAIGSVLYGTTKRAVAYFTQGVAKELADSPVTIGALSPGMVVTGLLTKGHDMDSPSWQRTSRVFSILADRVETVTPWLADQVLSNSRNGVRIAWLTRRKIMWRFLSSPFVHRDPFAE